MAIDSRTKIRVRRLAALVITVAALAVLLLHPPTAATQNPPEAPPGKPAEQPSGAAQGKGHDAVGQAQTNPVAAERRGSPMRGPQEIKETDAEPAVELDPELERSFRAKRGEPGLATVAEQWDKQGRPAVAGELPAFEKAKAIQQPGRPEPPKPDPRAEAKEEDEDRQVRSREAKGSKHLKLVLRLKADGSTEVVSATEMEGGAIFSEVPSSDYLYEVALGGKTIAAEALAGDPFEIHSFGSDLDERQGHHVETTDEATLVVSAPDVGLDPSLDRLEVKLHKLESGPPLDRVNPEVLEKLKREKRVKTVRSASAKDLAPGIRAHGVKKGFKE